MQRQYNAKQTQKAKYEKRIHKTSNGIVAAKMQGESMRNDIVLSLTEQTNTDIAKPRPSAEARILRLPWPVSIVCQRRVL